MSVTRAKSLAPVLYAAYRPKPALRYPSSRPVTTRHIHENRPPSHSLIEFPSIFMIDFVLAETPLAYCSTSDDDGFTTLIPRWSPRPSSTDDDLRSATEEIIYETMPRRYTCERGRGERGVAKMGPVMILRRRSIFGPGKQASPLVDLFPFPCVLHTL